MSKPIGVVRNLSLHGATSSGARTGAASRGTAQAAFEDFERVYQPIHERLQAFRWANSDGRIIEPLPADLREPVRAAFERLAADVPKLRAELGDVISESAHRKFTDMLRAADAWQEVATLSGPGQLTHPWAFAGNLYATRYALRDLALTEVAVGAAGGVEAVRNAGGLQALEGARLIATRHMAEQVASGLHTTERILDDLLATAGSNPESIAREPHLVNQVKLAHQTMKDVAGWLNSNTGVHPFDGGKRSQDAVGELYMLATNEAQLGLRTDPPAALLSALTIARSIVADAAATVETPAFAGSHAMPAMSMLAWALPRSVAERRAATLIAATREAVDIAVTPITTDAHRVAELERLRALATGVEELVATGLVLKQAQQAGRGGSVEAGDVFNAIADRYEAIRRSPLISTLPKGSLDDVDGTVANLRSGYSSAGTFPGVSFHGVHFDTNAAQIVRQMQLIADTEALQRTRLALQEATDVLNGHDAARQLVAAQDLLLAGATLLDAPSATRREAIEPLLNKVADLLYNLRLSVPRDDPMWIVAGTLARQAEARASHTLLRHTPASLRRMATQLGDEAPRLLSAVSQPLASHTDVSAAGGLAQTARAAFTAANRTSDDYKSIAATFPHWERGTQALWSTYRAAEGVVPDDLLRAMRTRLMRFDDQLVSASANRVPPQSGKGWTVAEEREPQRALVGQLHSDLDLVEDLLDDARKSVEV